MVKTILGTTCRRCHNWVGIPGRPPVGQQEETKKVGSGEAMTQPSAVFLLDVHLFLDAILVLWVAFQNPQLSGSRQKFIAVYSTFPK